MTNNKKSSSGSAGGIGFIGLLAIVFITLKLCGVIHWSWLWVLCPLWISFALGILILTGVLLWAVLSTKIPSKPKRR